MKMTESGQIRLWTLGLGIWIIVAVTLTVIVNPFAAALIYLAMLAGVVAAGLLTNVWGGLLASAVSVVALVLANEYAGIYPREDLTLNAAAELVAFLLVGPLAGRLAGAIDLAQRQMEHWLARVDELTVHDETFGTLKPAWTQVRLGEEVQRAACFGRPLSIALLQLAPQPGAAIINRAERIAALQALIRVGRAVMQPPAVVAHAGGDHVLVIMPEHTAGKAQQAVQILQKQIEREVYFPNGTGQRLGKPIREWGQLRVGLASANGQAGTAEALLAQARANLEK